jgi:hypothetical protein
VDEHRRRPSREDLAVPEALSPTEVGHVLAHDDAEEAARRRHGRIEIVEATLLAVVAVATAWSGYQTGKFDGRQAHLYGLSNKYRAEANRAATISGQQRLYDTTTFNFWYQTKVQGRDADAALFARRFRPEYRPAFRAWLRTDPFHNPRAPAGPIFMPQYRNVAADRSARFDRMATVAFDEGTRAREEGDRYLRDTVLLATVLFLVALAQKFTVRKVRLALLMVCAVMLVIAVALIVTSPRA